MYVVILPLVNIYTSSTGYYYEKSTNIFVIFLSPHYSSAGFPRAHLQMESQIRFRFTRQWLGIPLCTTLDEPVWGHCHCSCMRHTLWNSVCANIVLSTGAEG